LAPGRISTRGWGGAFNAIKEDRRGSRRRQVMPTKGKKFEAKFKQLIHGTQVKQQR